MNPGKKEIKKIKDLLKIEDVNWHILRLPKDLSCFFSKNKSLSPYDALYDWIFTKIEKYPWITVSDVYLTESDTEKLDAIVKKWLKTTHRLSGRRLEQTRAFVFLERSPATFQNKTAVDCVGDFPSSIKSGFVYVRKAEKK
jgi:hypothetical protein